jgi:RNA polymerase sigma-70 factor (ECF subfamily)
LLLLDRVLQQLAFEYAAAGKAQYASVLREFLSAGRDHRPYAEVADQLGLSAAAVKMAVHRLRKRYRALLRDAIGQTVADPAEIDDELRSSSPFWRDDQRRPGKVVVRRLAGYSSTRLKM